MGRSRWRSLFLSDADDVLEVFPAPRSALRPKRVALRAPQGFAPTGVREMIHPGGQIEVSQGGQIRLTNRGTSLRRRPVVIAPSILACRWHLVGLLLVQGVTTSATEKRFIRLSVGMATRIGSSAGSPEVQSSEIDPARAVHVAVPVLNTKFKGLDKEEA